MRAASATRCADASPKPFDELKTLGEKYLLKIRNRIGLPKNQFPRGSGEIVQRLRRHLEGNLDLYLLHAIQASSIYPADALRYE